MKKVSLSIEETLKYQREMVIEIPEEMSEDELNKILDSAQMKVYGADELPIVIHSLNNRINIVERPDNDLSSPWDSEIEIDDFDYIEG